MKRSGLGACLVLMVAMGFAASAQAGQQMDRVHSAQERLRDLGYYAGPIDGIAGPQTKQALSAFQREHGLEPSGALTPETYSLIDGRDYGEVYGYHNNYGVNSRASVNYRGLPYYGQISQASTASGVDVNQQARVLPIRFASLVVNARMNGSGAHYAVTLNGAPVLNANNQPEMLRVSPTYRLTDEDAVIFSAYDGTGGCPYKSYLLSVKRDGSHKPAQEIASCLGDYQAQVEGDMLTIRFTGRDGGNAGRDVWRYSHNRLGRVDDTLAGL